MKKTSKTRLDPSGAYRNLGFGAVKAPLKTESGTRATRITSKDDLRAPKGR